MGYSPEEQAPLNPPSQQTPPPQEQGQVQYPGQIPVDPYQYGQVPPGFIPYPPYGYAAMPQHFSIQRPILQVHEDRVGSQGLFTIGALLGFFAPITSLITLCCSTKLKFKHGLSFGHAIYYSLATLACLGVAFAYCFVLLPNLCGGVDTCMSDALSGANAQSWSPYVIDCNRTSYYEHFKNTNYTCPLPAFLDMDSDSDSSSEYYYSTELFGPQSYECASCACDYQSNYCAYAHSYSTYTWLCVFFSGVFMIIAFKASRYYRRRIDQEAISVYQL